MARLIDADVLKFELQCVIGNRLLLEGLFAEIDAAPTVDAVEVVRCLVCKRGHVAMLQREKHDITRIDGIKCERDRTIKGCTDFCNYGERREKD